MAVLLVTPFASRAEDPPENTLQGLFKAMQTKGAKGSVEPLEKTLDGAVDGYLKGRVVDAEAVLTPLAAKQQGKASSPLYLLSLGSVGLSLGDYQSVEHRLTAALQEMTVDLSDVATGIAMFRSESDRPYRGYPHERMLAHTYLGLAYFQQARYEDARIEFAQAREADHGSAAEHDGDFVTGHFLEGLTALRSGRYNDAQVSFRKVTELRKDWPLGWYALCRASELAHEDAEAGEAWAHYDTLATAGSRLARDGSTPCVLFMIESGRGPARKRDELIDQLGSWQKPTAPELALSLTPAGQPKVEARSVDDLYFQASTEGGIAGQAARKAVSSLAKAGVKHLFGDRSKPSKSEIDVRCWATSPGQVHIAAVPVPAQPTTVELACSPKAGGGTAQAEGFLDRLDKALDQTFADTAPGSHQVYRFLRGQPFNKAPVVYERILAQADTPSTHH